MFDSQVAINYLQDHGGKPMVKKRSNAAKSDVGGRVVAVTGTSEQLGSGLIGLMDSDPAYRRILAVDVRDPGELSPKASFHYVDLTTPEAGKELAEIFKANQVDTLAHLAFLSNPAHDPTYAHELQVAGTMHVLNAAAAAQLRKVVMLGTVMVYGARYDNPNFLTEEAPLRAADSNGFMADLLDVERQFWDFSKRRPDTVCTMLRMGARLGPQVDTFFSRMLVRPVVPTVMGYDPLIQLLHEKDALISLKIAMDNDHRGPFNIVADGVIPLSTIIKLAGRFTLPIPHFMGKKLGGFLWASQITTVPPDFLDYLKYLWVADGTKARKQMGMRYQYSTRDTILDWARIERINAEKADSSHEVTP